MQAARHAPIAVDNSGFVIKLNSRPDLAGVEQMPRGPERKRATYERLVEHARATQQPVVDLARQLQAKGLIRDFDTLVSPNALVVTPKGLFSKGKLKDAFARHPGVSIFDNYSGAQVWPPPDPQAATAPSPRWGLDVTSHREIAAPEAGRSWALDSMRAPEAWARGATGKGLVYGVIDTGVDASHEALRHAYRGTRPDGSFDHDYNWADFQRPLSKVPTDNHWGHGTHVTGSVVGRVRNSEFGVAPDAKFVGVRGLSDSIGDTLRALQWMQAPTRVGGGDPAPEKAPDVVGMSWFMGRPTEELFRESIQNLRSAGIEVVKSAGNNGPGPATISSPGHHPEILAAASVDKDGKVARSSSRGPALIPKDAPTPKPDFAAPGVNITSSITNNRYGELSGTSMAQPHLSGAVLAVLSKYPQLTHDELYAALSAGAVDAGAPGFDSEFGNGIINLPAALDAAQSLVDAKAPAA